MATHESWQFAFVKELDSDIFEISSLGSRSPLRVEDSNLVINSVPQEISPLEVVTGDHIRVYWSIPSDPNGFTLTGKLKVFRKTKEFVRYTNDSQAQTVIDFDFSTTLADVDRDTEFLYLDQSNIINGVKYYYTVFYEVTKNDSNETKWALSQIYGFDRSFVLDSGESTQGNKLYEYMPVGVRQKDYDDTSGTLYNFLQILGKAFDEYKFKLDKFSNTKFKVDRVDAALIPYIDQMLGWPTNFELGELRRREETENIINIWKGKGANDALELSIQNILNWDVELEQSSSYVLTTATGEEKYYEDVTPPNGWDENTDGVWENIRQNVVRNTIPDFSSRVVIRNMVNDNYRVMSDFSDNSWKSMYHFVVKLINPSQTGRPLLGSLIKQKVRRVLPYIAIHYSDFTLQSAESYTDGGEIDLQYPLENTFDDYPYRPSSDGAEIGLQESSVATGMDLLYTFTNSAPYNDTNNVIWSSSVGNSIFRTFHIAFDY
jgi:phage tail-like protein